MGRIRILDIDINYAPILGVVFGAFCWLGLYALYANFARRGLELMQGPGIIFNVQGAVMVGLYAAGLVLLLACGIGAIAVLVKYGIRESARDHASEADRPL